MPVTPNAYDTTYAGNKDGYVFVLDLPGTVVACTYVGGGGQDALRWSTIQDDGSVVGIAYTRGDFPLTGDALDTTNYSPGGYYEEAAVFKVSADLSQLLFSSYWGGSDADRAYAGLKDGSDSVWVGGFTWARDFPLTDDAIRRTGGGWPTNFLSHLYIGTGSGTDLPRTLTPQELTLTCYPNPFNATAILRFTLPRSGDAQLLVYDLLGRKVLDENLGKLPAGEHRHTLDASDLPSGICFARLEALGLERVQKMVVLR